MLTLDGSTGEGGGQIVRSALALSIVTQRPVTINRIRAKRDKPGLRRQHLTAVRAAAGVCAAQVDGADLGSSRLVFRPQAVNPGSYDFPIGTAGSTTLVLQTVLPALLAAPSPSTLSLEGGTHNPLAPPFEFIANTYLPLIRRLGMVAEASLVRYGFYPAGGGKIEVNIQPGGPYKGLDLLQRGAPVGQSVRAIVANLPAHIGHRECETIGRLSGWDESCFSVEQTRDADGPGNVVLVELNFENVTETFVGFGKKGVRAEQVAQLVWNEVAEYLEVGVPVGEHLADQLILPLAISAFRGGGGGRFRTLPLSQHCQTHLDVIRQFMDLQVDIDQEEGGVVVSCQ